jgi:hypothetical protein
MNTKNNYTPVGPLTDETLYIERKADSELFHFVHAMEYVTIVEPRQQGKTSLIRHLMTASPLPEWSFVYIDISTLDTRSEHGWYQTLCRRISIELKMLLDVSPGIPQNSFEWRDFLSNIAIHARQAGKKIVIVLDEIGGAKFDDNTSFFKTLREVYISRQFSTNSEFQNLTFILVGSFNPQDLIQDPAISPFNIAQQVHLADFTVDQVRELMMKRGWKEEKARISSQSIYYWTSGQPYLSQLLCTYLSSDASPSNVDNAIEKLRREDTNNLPHLIARLETNSEMKGYVRKIWAGEAVPFYPEIPLQRQLLLSGWIKIDEKGFCAIRNRIYERIISELLKTLSGTVVS